MNNKPATKKAIPTWRVLLVVLIFIGPILMAIWMYSTRENYDFNTSNYGELLQPLIPAATLALQDENAKPVEIINADGIWHLVYLQQGTCTADCKLNLEKLQTTRRALGRNVNLLKNIAVVPADNLASLQEQPHQTIQLATTNGDTIQHALEKFPAGFLVIDPQGNIVMRYPSDAQGNGILRDVRKLLRVSSHG